MSSVLTAENSAMSMIIRLNEWRINKTDYLDTLQMLTRLLKGGVPLRRALQVMINDISHSKLKRDFKSLQAALEQGSNLSEAIQLSAIDFPGYVTELIETGEETGQLVGCLEHAVEHLRRRISLQRKVHEALLYPLLVFFLGVVAVLVMFKYVIPNMTAFYAEYGEELPSLTLKILWIEEHLILMGFSCAFLVIGAWSLFRWKVVIVEHFRWLPWVGPMIRLYKLGLFSDRLSLYLKNGVPILRAIKNLQHSLPELKSVEASLITGEPLSKSMTDLPWLSKSAQALISTAEETGMLDHALKEIASTVEEDFYYKMQQTVRLLEPTCLLIVGGIICVIVVGMFLPMIEMNDFV